MNTFDDHTNDILDGLRKDAWTVPVDPEGDAAYWRARAERAEQDAERLAEALRDCVDPIEILVGNVPKDIRAALAAHDEA